MYLYIYIYLFFIYLYLCIYIYTYIHICAYARMPTTQVSSQLCSLENAQSFWYLRCNIYELKTNANTSAPNTKLFLPHTWGRCTLSPRGRKPSSCVYLLCYFLSLVQGKPYLPINQGSFELLVRNGAVKNTTATASYPALTCSTYGKSACYPSMVAYRSYEHA